LKELLGNVKAKVEGMGGDTGVPPSNIMAGEEKNPQHSHQYDTTMKHADNPTYQQRMAAHDIKPGIKGYRDRIDLLKDLERTGKLKGQEEAFDPLKHVKNPTQGEKDAAKDVKRSSYADRAALLKSAEADGRLKSEESAFEAIMRLANYKK
jgi:hypothetical protein